MATETLALKMQIHVPLEFTDAYGKNDNIPDASEAMGKEACC